MVDPVTGAALIKATEVVAKDVYSDAAKPALAEAGHALAMPVKVLTTALRPVRSLLLAANLVFDRLDGIITEKLKDVPPEKVVEPPTSVVGPLLLAYAFAEGEPSLQELYEQLLASAMHADTTATIHPSFVEVLRQLSADEAVIIRRLHEQQRLSHPIIRVDHLGASGGAITVHEIGLVWSFYEDSDLKHPEFNGTYLDNLVRLRILEIDFEGAVLGVDYSKLQEYANEMSSTAAKPGMGVNLVKGRARVTRFGTHFISACCGFWGPSMTDSKATG